MPNDIRIRASTLVSTYTFSGTDAQFAAILTRFARAMGIPITGTNQQNLDAIRDHFVDETRRGSKAIQAADLRAANEATIASQIEIDNPL